MRPEGDLGALDIDTQREIIGRLLTVTLLPRTRRSALRP